MTNQNQKIQGLLKITLEVDRGRRKVVRASPELEDSDISMSAETHATAEIIGQSQEKCGDSNSPCRTGGQ